MNAPNLLFGGKTIVLGGDFRQTLPVKKGVAKEELIAASIRSEAFAKWLLDVGNGEIGEPGKEDDQDNSWIVILPNYLVSADETRLSQLIDFIYDDKTLKTPTAGALQEKEIVCPKNETTDVVNAKILSDIEGQCRTYLSNDEAIPMGKETSEREFLYPMEYLNTITILGFPPYELELKVGSLIMLLRNVNLSGGLCNGTRMIVKSLMSKLIEAQIITGIRVGKKNNAIQANIYINNIDYFNPLLKPQAAYKFLNFICDKTKAYHQTLENQISLNFRKITKFETLTGNESEFLEHHFEFIAYNQLASRVPYRDENSKMIYPILTDYLGCIRSISDVVPFGDANTAQKYGRKVDIENVEMNLQNSLTDKRLRSCHPHSSLLSAPTELQNTKLAATPATYYYINPRTPEAEYTHTA
ncbi:DNA helicase [Tanacetum coccineum]